jgi:class 3 adenylate cyclase
MWHKAFPGLKAMAITGPASERKPTQEFRKTATFLFADIVDSSRLSLTLDAEAFQNLLVRYFGEMSSIIQRHGGTVNSYAGDAIFATFGVPMLHEDDALRAARAAVEMRDTLAILNHELEAGWGVRLAQRIGLNTGEVITGSDRQEHRFLSGEAVRVAKRLEEAAEPNEILIGEQTHRLLRETVVVKSSSPRGKARIFGYASRLG